MAPHAFSLLCIPEEVADALIAQGCIANENIAINFYSSHHLSPITYVGYVEGLSNLEEPATLEMLVVSMCATLLTLKEVQEAILDHVMEKEIMNTIIGDLTLGIILINVKRGKDLPVVNIFLPTLGQVSEKCQDKILEVIKGVNFSFSLFGSGMYGRGFKCIQCHGMDHPASLCPFKDIEGWREICRIDSDTLDQYREHIFKRPSNQEGPSSLAIISVPINPSQVHPGDPGESKKGRKRTRRHEERQGLVDAPLPLPLL